MTTEDKRADLARVVDKIRKLFALGQSPNENEAAAAVAKAQSMLAAYDLTMDSIEDLKADARTGIREGTTAVQTTEGKPDGWKADLFEIVARTSDCYTAYHYTPERTKSGRYRTLKQGYMIGFGHDVEAAGYAVHFLIHEIERLAQAYADVMWAEIREIEAEHGWSHQQAESYYVSVHERHPLKAKLYFTKGAADAVCSKLDYDHWVRKQEARRAAEAAGNTSTAIVLHKKAAVEDYLYMKRYGKTKAQFDAEWEAKIEALRAERPEAPATVETEAQKAKREAKERRNRDRYYEAQQRRYEREEAKVDRHAHRAGQEAGANINIRPGVKAGQATKELE